jgi:hypothetical protein
MSAKDTYDGDEAKVDDRRNSDNIAESKSPSRSSEQGKNQRESAARKAIDDGGGWFDSSPKKGRRNKIIEAEEPESDEEDQQHLSSTRKKNTHRDDDDDDMIIIPDLEDDGGLDGGSDARVAQAPRNVMRKIPTLDELESAVQLAIPSVNEGGYDLSVLTSTLVPAVGLKELDEVWEFDGLLREVTDELTDTPKTVVSATISTSMAAALAKEKKSTKKKQR